jgi:hypothetical protein
MFAEMVVNYTRLVVVAAVGIPLVVGPVLLLTYWLTRENPGDNK